MAWECSKCKQHLLVCGCRREELKKNPMQALDKIMTEYGTVGNVSFADVKMCNADGEEVMCQCGKPATTALMGKDCYVTRCNDCMGFNQ